MTFSTSLTWQEILKNHLAAAGLSQRAFALDADIPDETVSRALNSRVRPSDRFLRRLERPMGLPVNTLVDARARTEERERRVHIDDDEDQNVVSEIRGYARS